MKPHKSHKSLACPTVEPQDPSLTPKAAGSGVITKKDRRERRITKVTAVEILRLCLYGAPFEDCVCGGGKRPTPESPCFYCGRPHDSVYIKPPPQDGQETEE